MNYVELTYNALSAKYTAHCEDMRLKVIKEMNDGNNLDEIDGAIESWAITIQKINLLNSMVDRKDESQTGQNQTADATQSQN
tara:strand:+ start:540 stop:785 length:246 start_codon:yes stop_codon:yes gene_type:complete